VVITWLTGVETINTADQGCIWLVRHRSVCGCRLCLRPKRYTPALSETRTAPLQLQYAASGTIQVLYAFAFDRKRNIRFKSSYECI